MGTYDFAPRVTLMVAHVNDTFPALGLGGTYYSHGDDEDGDGLDDEEFSADFWTTNKAVHDQVFYWSIKNAKELGLKYVISWNRIWSVARADEGIRQYSSNLNASASKLHKNHVHHSYRSEAETMAVQVTLSDAQILKLADAIGDRILDKDYITAPETRIDPANPTWQLKSFPRETLEVLDQILEELKKP
jgi:hypothetical protein